MLPVCRLSDEHPHLQSKDFVDSATQLFADSKAEMLHGKNDSVIYCNEYVCVYQCCHSADMFMHSKIQDNKFIFIRVIYI